MRRMDDVAEQIGYSLRELAAAGAGYAPAPVAGVRKMTINGRMFTLDDRFVPLADYEALRAECERLAAERAAGSS